MLHGGRAHVLRSCVWLVVALALALVRPASADIVLGGGAVASDCYGALDVRGSAGSRRVTCVDGDPACDVDGQCQGTCTFEIAVCVNRSGVPGCTPRPLRKPPKVAGAALPVPAPQGGEAVCGPTGTVEVALKGRRRTRSRTKKVQLTVVTAGRPRQDSDTVILRCEARREDTCPTTTTTVDASVTTTSAGSVPTSTTDGTPTTTTTSTTLSTTGPCDDDDDCPGAVCSQGVCCNRACAAPCNVCSAATGGICTPVGCGMPGECQTGPGACNASTGACAYPVASDGAACGAEIAGRVCCGGACCAAGENCVDGACQAPCSTLGGTCQGEEQCCQDGVTACDGGTCCHGVEESCSTDSQCCSGRCRDGETCCSPPGSPCHNEGDCCTGELGDCTGVVNKTCRCLQPGQSCTSSQECCGTDVCVNGECKTGVCIAPQAACRDSLECCWSGSTICSVPEFRCCRANAGACSAQGDCCAGETCQGGDCCRAAGQTCNSNTLCCPGLSCREGTCLPTCPLAAFPCGATCCGSYQHCVAGTCQCVPLQGACDPANNLCCQSEETLCPASSLYGNARTCCRPQGGHCSSGADCCTKIEDLKWSRDSCGNDGICGGNDAYCGSDAQCVGGLRCIGLCVGPGQGFKLCVQSSECPSGQLCGQMRCIDPDALPK